MTNRKLKKKMKKMDEKNQFMIYEIYISHIST